MPLRADGLSIHVDPVDVYLRVGGGGRRKEEEEDRGGGDRGEEELHFDLAEATARLRRTSHYCDSVL